MRGSKYLLCVVYVVTVVVQYCYNDHTHCLYISTTVCLVQDKKKVVDKALLFFLFYSYFFFERKYLLGKKGGRSEAFTFQGWPCCRAQTLTDRQTDSIVAHSF